MLHHDDCVLNYLCVKDDSVFHVCMYIWGGRFVGYSCFYMLFTFARKTLCDMFIITLSIRQHFNYDFIPSFASLSAKPRGVSNSLQTPVLAQDEFDHCYSRPPCQTLQHDFLLSAWLSTQTTAVVSSFSDFFIQCPPVAVSDIGELVF